MEIKIESLMRLLLFLINVFAYLTSIYMKNSKKYFDLSYTEIKKAYQCANDNLMLIFNKKLQQNNVIKRFTLPQTSCYCVLFSFSKENN